MSSEFLLNEATLEDTASCIRFTIYETYSKKKVKSTTLKHLFREPEDAVTYLERSGYIPVEGDTSGTKYSMVVGSVTRIAKITNMNVFTFE